LIDLYRTMYCRRNSHIIIDSMKPTRTTSFCFQSDYIHCTCAKRVYYSHGSALRCEALRTSRVTLPLPTCTTAKLLFTRQRYATLLCRARSKKSYQHGTGTISACLVPLVGVLFVRQRDSSAAVCNADGRYPHGKVLFCPLPGAK